jgi:thioredoxin 1
MSFVQDYTSTEPSREEVNSLAGATVLEFGNSWCGYCRQAEPLIEKAFQKHATVRHIRVADESGRRLGRSFNVKLWPTLIFLKEGKEISRLIRPYDFDHVENALNEIDPSSV